MNHLAILVFAISVTVVSTATFAQAVPAVASAPAAPTQARPAGTTRAEVIAEMKAARLRGELQAGHDWVIDVPPVQRAGRRVQLAKHAE